MIIVSLRTAASAEAPPALMLLSSRLPSEGQNGNGEGACQRALTERRTLRAAAHSRSVICVFLRMAAIAVAPLAPILLPMRL